MADFSTIARPYARAAFEYAREHKALAGWSENLRVLAAAAEHDEVQPLLGNNPKVTPAMLVELFTGLVKLDEAQRNFVRLLAARRRLRALPAIAAEFAALRAAAESRVDVELRAATEVEKGLADKIAAALKQRLGRDVALQTVVDESLLGGAVIRAGDLVIDDSVRGKLDRLAAELTH